MTVFEWWVLAVAVIAGVVIMWQRLDRVLPLWEACLWIIFAAIVVGIPVAQVLGK